MRIPSWIHFFTLHLSTPNPQTVMSWWPSWIALRANISETVLVLLINEQGEKEKGKDERKFSWFCFFWELGCHATERRRAWRAEAGTLNMNDRLRVQVPYRVCWGQL